MKVIDKNKLKASICRDSFYDFVRMFWDVIIHEEPVWNWHIEAICGILQEVAERVFRGEARLYDLLINVPPGTTKSTICSRMFPAWVWTRMPTARSLCCSYADALAMDLSRSTRDIVQSEKWQELFPEIQLKADQNAKSYFMNTHDGFRFAVGTEGAVTGMHGHFLIVDDPLDPERAFSEAELKNANRWVSETLGSRKVDKQVSVTIVIMQRLHQNDPAAVMLEKSKRPGGPPVRHVNLPAEVAGTGLDIIRPRKFARHYVKDKKQEGMKLLDQTRLPRHVLEEQKIILGPYGYSGQMLQNPVPPGGGMFKVGRIRIDTPPKDIDFAQFVRFWDKAGTQDGGAFTAGVKMGRDKQGRFWILNVVRGQWESSAREKIILQTALVDTVRCEVGLEQEPGSGGKESAQATLRMLAGFIVRIDRPTGSKELRADPLSVQVNGENVYMAPGPWNQALLEEFQYFPRSHYKDQVDAASGAFTLLARPVVRAGGLW